MFIYRIKINIIFTLACVQLATAVHKPHQPVTLIPHKTFLVLFHDATHSNRASKTNDIKISTTEGEMGLKTVHWTRNKIKC
jgi:hypothetical protein